MSYSSLYFTYKKEMSLNHILYGSIPSAKWRLLIYAFLLFFTMALGMILDQAILVAGSLVVASVFRPIVHNMDKHDLLKKYNKEYEFFEIEKKDYSTIVNSIQVRRLKDYLGNRVNDLEYLKALSRSAWEHSDNSKRDLSLKKMGVVAVVVIILNNYFNTLYEGWKSRFNEIELIEKTFWLIFGIALLYGGYYLVKLGWLKYVNSGHERHKEIYFILKDFEILAQFPKEKEGTI